MTGLTVKSDGVEFSFSLSSSLAKETEFYLKAINPDGLSATSPKMKITSSPICDSYTSVIQADKTILKTAQTVVYIDEIVGVVPEFKDYFPFSDIIKSFKLDKLDSQSCAIKSPYLVVNSTSQKEQPPLFTYQIDNNVILVVNSSSLEDTTASLKVDSGGFKSTFTLQIPDIQDNNIQFEVTLVVCGSAFWEKDICTKTKPEVTNNKPTIVTPYIIELKLQDQYAIFEEGVKANDSVKTDSLKYSVDFGYVSDYENETVDIQTEISSKFSDFVSCNVTGSNITLDVDMLNFYNSALAVPEGG